MRSATSVGRWSSRHPWRAIGAVIRAVLLPASMKLLGEWNWYLPRAFRRLPRAAVEAEVEHSL